MLQNLFSLRQFRQTKVFFSYVQCSTTRNAPYVHTRLDSILELCRTFPIEQTSSTTLLLYVYPLYTDSSVYLFCYNTRKIRIVRSTYVVIFQNNYVFLTCINTSLLVSLFLLVRHLFSVNLPKLRKSRKVKTQYFPRQNIALHCFWWSLLILVFD